MATRITRANFKDLEEYVLDTFKERRDAPERKSAEFIWSEIDRQVRLTPQQGISESGQGDQDWHSAIEVGDLSTASEIFAADVIRLVFGGDSWYSAHSDLSDVDMEVNLKEKAQKKADSDLRHFMNQQHKDFGLKAAVKLSLKEVAHHGAMVATVQPATLVSSPIVTGGRAVNTLKAPTWRAHSMWNCFPDPNPSVVGTRLFYDGSMIVRSYIKPEQVPTQNWMNKKKILDSANKKPIEVITMYGPIFIPRKSASDIYIPNGIVQIANDIIAMAQASEWPFPNVIYTGYERIDAKDPYYSSPLMKHSAMQTLASRCANQFLDSVALQTEPPIIFSKMSPAFADEPPAIAPREQIPVGSGGDIRELRVGNPEAALAGLEFAKTEMKVGVGIDATRAGVDAGVEQTAEEIRTKNARSEVRVVDFIGDFEEQALKPFLYMQHWWNVQNVSSYPYYNPDIGQEDHKKKTKDQLPEDVIFELIGSKDVLGETRRATQLLQVTQSILNIEEVKGMIDLPEIVKDLYRDAGARNKAEVYVKTPSEQDEQVIDQRIVQLEQEIQALSQAAQQTEDQFQQQLSALQQETDNTRKENMNLNTKIHSLTVDKQKIELRLQEKQSELELQKTEKQSLVEENRIMQQRHQLEKVALQGKANLSQGKGDEKIANQIAKLEQDFAEAASNNSDDDTTQQILESMEQLVSEINKPKNKNVSGSLNGKDFNVSITEQ